MPVDYKKYPKEWKRIRATILDRAQNRCEQCKATNHDWVWRGITSGRHVYQTADMVVYCANTGEWVADTCLDLREVVGLNGDKLTKIVLTISHTDHDTTNNDPSNLRALCQRCHLLHDKELHAANARATRRKRSGLMSMFDEAN